MIALGTGSLSPGDAFQKQGFVRKGSENVVGPMPHFGEIFKTDDDNLENHRLDQGGELRAAPGEMLGTRFRAQAVNGNGYPVARAARTPVASETR